MGAILDNIRIIREQHKYDRKTNPDANQEFKKAVLEAYPGIKPNLFEGLQSHTISIDALQRVYLMRFFFGAKFSQESTLKVELTKLWNASEKSWDKFTNAVFSMNSDSEELLDILNAFEDEAAECLAQTGKTLPFNVNDFLDKFFKLADFDAVVSEEIAEENDIEYQAPIFDKLGIPSHYQAVIGSGAYHLPVSENVKKWEELNKAKPTPDPSKQGEKPALTNEQKEALVAVVEKLKEEYKARLMVEGAKNSRVETAIDNSGKTVVYAIYAGTVLTEKGAEEFFTTTAKASATLVKREEEVEKATKGAETAKQLHSMLTENKKLGLPKVVERLNALGEAPVALLTGVTVPEFLAINSYPFNRDTVERMKKEHLNGEIVNVLQKKVAVVKLDKERNADVWAEVEKQCGELEIPCSLPWMKLDGHSRAEAWDTIKEGAFVLAHPEEIYVDVFQGDEWSDSYIRETVKIFGSSASDLNAKERAQMANKELKLDPKSGLVNSSWANPFRLVGIRNKASAEQEGREKYKEALIFIDGLMLEATYTKNTGLNTYIPSGIKGGILMSWDVCQKRGIAPALWRRFWMEYFYHTGFAPSLPNEYEPEKVIPPAVDDLKAFMEDEDESKQRGFDGKSAAKAETYFENYVKAASRKQA